MGELELKKIKEFPRCDISDVYLKNFDLQKLFSLKNIDEFLQKDLEKLYKNDIADIEGLLENFKLKTILSSEEFKSYFILRNYMLVRHGEPVIENGEKRDLSEKGKKQVEELASKLGNIQKGVNLFYGESKRARQTADIIKKSVSLQEFITDSLNSTPKTSGNLLLAPQITPATEEFFIKLLYSLKENNVIVVHKTNVGAISSLSQRWNASIEGKKQANINEEYMLLENHSQSTNLFLTAKGKLALDKDSDFIHLDLENYNEIKEIVAFYNEELYSYFQIYEKGEISLSQLQTLFNLYNYAYDFYLVFLRNSKLKQKATTILEKNIEKEIFEILETSDNVDYYISLIASRYSELPYGPKYDFMVKKIGEVLKKMYDKEKKEIYALLKQERLVTYNEEFIEKEFEKISDRILNLASNSVKKRYLRLFKIKELMTKFTK